MKEILRKKLKKVKLLILDVDGVLTKGEIIYDSRGRELKVFNVKDGLGIFLLSKLGINTVLFTAKDSAIVRRRAVQMGVREVFGGILPKARMIESIKKKYRVKEGEICYIGDDLVDISIMKEVGLPIAVKDASEEVKRIAVYVTRKEGGGGAVREIVEMILRAKNMWRRAVTNFDSLIKS